MMLCYAIVSCALDYLRYSSRSASLAFTSALIKRANGEGVRRPIVVVIYQSVLPAGRAQHAGQKKISMHRGVAAAVAGCRGGLGEGGLS
jgi:hypothetical protein